MGTPEKPKEKTVRCPHCNTQIIAIEGSNWFVKEYFERPSYPVAKFIRIGEDGEPIETESDEFFIHNELIICTSEDCKQPIFNVGLRTRHHPEYHHGGLFMGGPYFLPWGDWKLLPSSTAKHYPAGIVHPAIIEDYEEGSDIISLSPKAAATLFRRAIQGMIRDFWKISVKSKKLVDEIKAIETLVDPEVWDAIDSLRTTGNIGAHMEEDINTIIEVDDGEADQLKWLVELLIEEWYILRHERQKRLKGVAAIGPQKTAQKKAAKALQAPSNNTSIP